MIVGVIALVFFIAIVIEMYEEDKDDNDDDWPDSYFRQQLA